jgi:hypothetical protein
VRYLLAQTWNQNYERVGVASTDATTGPCSPDIELSLFRQNTVDHLCCATPEEISMVPRSRGIISCILPRGCINICRLHSRPLAGSRFATSIRDCTNAPGFPIYIFRNYKRIRWRLVARIFVICGHGNTRDNRHGRTGITLAFLFSSLVYCKCTVPARSLYSSIAIGA